MHPGHDMTGTPPGVEQPLPPGTVGGLQRGGDLVQPGLAGQAGNGSRWSGCTLGPADGEPIAAAGEGEACRDAFVAPREAGFVLGDGVAETVDDPTTR
jgi:hypothetical protein